MTLDLREFRESRSAPYLLPTSMSTSAVTIIFPAKTGLHKSLEFLNPYLSGKRPPCEPLAASHSHPHHYGIHQHKDETSAKNISKGSIACKIPPTSAPRGNNSWELCQIISKSKDYITKTFVLEQS